jgi:hypothetical protein
VCRASDRPYPASRSSDGVQTDRIDKASVHQVDDHLEPGLQKFADLAAEMCRRGQIEIARRANDDFTGTSFGS